MHILIIGGTGFIGYHATLAFHNRGHQVSVLALPPLPVEGIDPPDVEFHLVDMNHLRDADLLSLLHGKDAIVFAAGADDRSLPKAPAYPFFYRANVASCGRIVKLAREAGVKRGTIIGSYFAHFDRSWPELELKEHHPYIRSRIEQVICAQKAARPGLALTVLELPFVFGAMPGRTPMWAPLIRFLQSPLPLFFPRGGTNMISIEHVAEAIVGAIDFGQAGDIYLVGDENLPYADLLERLMVFTGKKKSILTLPNWITRLGTEGIRMNHWLRGRESGLDPGSFTALLTAETYFDPSTSRVALGYGQGGLDRALKETVEACLN